MYYVFLINQPIFFTNLNQIYFSDVCTDVYIVAQLFATVFLYDF